MKTTMQFKLNGCLAGGLLTLAAMIPAGAQNAVVNTGYEAHCIKSGYGELCEAKPWTNANGGSADLFDKKKTSRKSPNGIPYNYMGCQPSDDGQNYAGIVAYYDDASLFDTSGYKRYTEYVEAELRDQLVAGTTYEVSFKVNLADKSGRAVSCLGALLTSEKVKQSNNTFLSLVPQFISHQIIADSGNWVTLSGAYLASGGEKYITIGCFKDADFQVMKVVPPFVNDSRKAYYYVSEVSVTPYVSPKQNMEALTLGVDYVELMDVQFATASSAITPGFYKELDDVASWMVQYPDYKFFVAGYADQRGNDALNDPLSRARAESVKKYLVSKGANADNILTDGFGSSDPIEHKLKSRKNRRVEIYLYSTVKLSQL